VLFWSVPNCYAIAPQEYLPLKGPIYKYLITRDLRLGSSVGRAEDWKSFYLQEMITSFLCAFLLGSNRFSSDLRQLVRNKQKFENRQGVDWERSGNGPNRIPIAYRIFKINTKPTGLVLIRSWNKSGNNRAWRRSLRYRASEGISGRILSCLPDSIKGWVQGPHLRETRLPGRWWCEGDFSTGTLKTPCYSWPVAPRTVPSGSGGEYRQTRAICKRPGPDQRRRLVLPYVAYALWSAC